MSEPESFHLVGPSSEYPAPQMHFHILMDFMEETVYPFLILAKKRYRSFHPNTYKRVTSEEPRDVAVPTVDTDYYVKRFKNKVTVTCQRHAQNMREKRLVALQHRPTPLVLRVPPRTPARDWQREISRGMKTLMTRRVKNQIHKIRRTWIHTSRGGQSRKK